MSVPPQALGYLHSTCLPQEEAGVGIVVGQLGQVGTSTLFTLPVPSQSAVSIRPHDERYLHFPPARHVSPIFGSLAGHGSLHDVT
jgi:hypothetical protein